MSRGHWTPLMDHQLGQNIDAELSTRRIAAAMGLTEGAVAGRAARLGWPIGRPRTMAQIERADMLKRVKKLKRPGRGQRVFETKFFVACDDEMADAIKERARQHNVTFAEMVRCLIEWGLEAE